MLPTRLRKNTAVRNLIRETQLSMNDVVYPLFIVDGQGVRKEIGSMKDQYHLSLDMLGAETLALKELGIRYVILLAFLTKRTAKPPPPL